MVETALSGLIRANAAESANVRALTTPAPPPRPDPQLTALQADNAALRQALAGAQAQEDARVESARTEAYRAAEAAFAARHQESLTLLGEALTSAKQRFGEKLTEIETLALAVNKAALAQAFEPADDLHDRCARAITRQFQDLREAALVELQVSAADFPTAAALDTLAQSLAANLTVRAEATLGAGEARFLLNYGGVELSLPQHWRALCGLFEHLASAR